MGIDVTYDRLVTHCVPGPQSLSYFIPITLLHAALLIPPSKASKKQLYTTFLPIITAATLHAWNAMGGVDVLSVDILLWSCYMLLFRDPRRDFRRILWTPRNKQAVSKKHNSGVEHRHATLRVKQWGTSVSPREYIEQSYPQSLLDRLPWVGTLLISLRLTDWETGISPRDTWGSSRRAHPSHLRFILTALLRTFFGYLILDVTSAWTQHDAYFRTPGQSIDSPLHDFEPLPSWVPRFFRSIVMALQAWAIISEQFHLPCAIPVFLHWLGLLPDAWSPHLWPPFFGSFSDMFTAQKLGALRIFWGRYWHQVMRNHCAGPGIWLADTMKLRRESVLRYALLVSTTFFFSGIVHMGLVPPKPIHATTSANHIRLLIAAFFWIQPLGFAIEALASNLLRRFQVSKLAFMGLNITWFVAWSCAVLPLLGEAGRQLGYWRIYPVPLSFWNKLQTGEWMVWRGT